MTDMNIGFIVNPIAGMGGRVGLKGTDGVVALARKLGAKPVSPYRAREFIDCLLNTIGKERPAPEFFTCSEPMGEDILLRYNFPYQVLYRPVDMETSRQDTIKAVHEIIDKVDILVFVGGDGTARDVYDALKEADKLDKPILGVPSGVKMYSGVFAATPCDAAEVLYQAFHNRIRYEWAEVIDIDENAFRSDRLEVKIYGQLKVPYIPMAIQSGKTATILTEDEVENQRAIARTLIEEMDPEALYILGPGTTVKAVADELDIKKTILGVDAYYKGKVYNDINEEKIKMLMQKAGKTYIVITPIGRQGFILGRGNLQISPEILEKIPKENIIILATHKKLGEIEGGVLRVDTHSKDLDKKLKGYMKVIIDYKTWRLVKVI
jgi:predicted polyphosphate/ATP-dependent NAD kinase